MSQLRFQCPYCFKNFVNINSHLTRCQQYLASDKSKIPSIVTLNNVDNVKSLEDENNKLKSFINSLVDHNLETEFNNINNNINLSKVDSVPDHISSQIVDALAKNYGFNDTYHFLLTNDLICMICFEPTPNKLECLHPLCTICIEKVLTSINQVCPMCHTSIQKH